MRVFIYACESIYGGMHGIYDQTVCEVDSIDEAYDIGLNMATKVIESYDIFDEEEDIEREVLVWKILDDVTLSTYELEDEACSLNYESFVEEYCKDEVLER